MWGNHSINEFSMLHLSAYLSALLSVSFPPLPSSLCLLLSVFLCLSLFLSLSLLLYSLTLSSRITLSDNPEVALLIKFSVDLRD